VAAVLVGAAASPAQAGVTLSERDAFKAIKREAVRDGKRSVMLNACRRLNSRRVTCSIHVTRSDGARVIDRYVAYRARSGRIGVAHRPILPPATGH